jgi:peptidoglycan/xylan/chitin deacetylase (PgdA/CDA1 family)
MRVLKFHGAGGDDYPSPSLEANLEYLADRFTIVPLAWIVKRAAARNYAAAGEMALTFDDGLRNNYTVAYPILARLGLPATFFVCPGLIESGRWLWSHEARERLGMLSEAALADLGRRLEAPALVQGVAGLITWMKTLSRRSRELVEESIRSATPQFRPTPEQRERFDPLTWDDLAAMSPDVTCPGAHTMTHPSLRRLASEELLWEVRESRRSVEEKLGRQVEDFCYPFGHWNEAVVDSVRLWYRSAVTSDPGRVEAPADVYRLRRISVTPFLPRLMWRLHRPTA